jgi:hypothetical protein
MHHRWERTTQSKRQSFTPTRILQSRSLKQNGRISLTKKKPCLEIEPTYRLSLAILRIPGAESCLKFPTSCIVTCWDILIGARTISLERRLEKQLSIISHCRLFHQVQRLLCSNQALKKLSPRLFCQL